jgi:hypothetical protein
MVESEVDGRKNLDAPFLYRSVERIREFLKADMKLTQENAEVSKCSNFFVNMIVQVQDLWVTGC